MNTAVYPRIATINTDVVNAYRDNIRGIEQHIDGVDVTLVETVDHGNGFRTLLPFSQRAATEALIRELRRYADYLEQGHQ